MCNRSEIDGSASASVILFVDPLLWHYGHHRRSISIVLWRVWFQPEWTFHYVIYFILNGRKLHWKRSLFGKTQIPHFLCYETGGKSHGLLDINSLSHSTVYAVESQCSSQRCVPFNTLISPSIGFRIYLFAAYVFMNVMVVHLIKYVNFHSRMSNTNTQ